MTVRNLNKYLFILIVSFLIPSSIFGQSFKISKIEPPNWWVKMKLDTVQLMVYGKNLNGVRVRSKNLIITKITNAQNNSYLFVDVFIPPKLSNGKYTLIFEKNGKMQNILYPILKRSLKPADHLGFNNEDVIYLIFADRFDDGDTTNDHIANPFEQFKPRTLNGRYGGDIQGIIDKLDYLKNLGVTALWITPLLENNMWMSYHGYAATNLYKIDPRFGSNKLYKKLVYLAHKKGLKIILDHVSNHIGINHPWIKNLPFDNWINGTVKKHLHANNNKIAFIDIHGDKTTPKLTERGWFTNYMPDSNQRNPFLAKYLIENTIWWIEYAGIDGIREDTYSYVYQKYEADWAAAILREYPNFNIVGEVWTGNQSFLAKYQKDSFFKRPFNSNLPALIDFAMYDSFTRYLKGKKGLWDIYSNFAKDFVYKNFNNLLLFMDNHDVDRAMYAANNNYKKVKLVLTMLLTTRSIPQIFYGDEIGLNGGGKDGLRRAPFPGGFPNDSLNAFTSKGRTRLQKNIFNFTRRLLHLRKKYPALRKGKFVQFPPEKGIYYYFKIFKNQKILVVINGNKFKSKVDLSDAAYLFGNSKKLINLNTNRLFKIDKDNETIIIEPMHSEIFLLKD